MESLLFAVNAVAPIILLVVIGYLLKRAGFIKESFIKSGNKLVFRIFLPAMLFLNIYKIETFSGIKLGYILYVAVVLLAVFLISIPLCLAVAKKRESVGALLQATFRSNYALIGIPLAQSLFGEEGAMVATLLSAVSISMFNVLAVISLTAFRAGGKATSVKEVLTDIVKNPLLQSIALGLLALVVRSFFVRWGVGFRLDQIEPIFKVLSYLSNIATPLALLVLGAEFEFSAIKGLRREIVFGTLMRTLIVPLFGIGIAFLFFAEQFTGAHFAAFVAVFATPVAVSSVPMAQEMGGDATLAGQLVVWTTLFSAISVFLAAFLLRLGGIF